VGYGVEAFARDICNDDFAKDKPAETSTSISFTASTKVIACSTFEDFRAAYQISVKNSLYNDGIYLVASVGVGTITTTEDLVDEAVGEDITVAESIIPLQAQIAIAQIIWYNIKRKVNLKAKSLGDGSETYATQYPDHLIDMLPRKVSNV
jgi:hypothetical protein